MDSAAPMPDAADGSDSGSLLPPVDAGDPFGDAGALGDPEWVDVVVHTDDTMCDALTPCGGDEVGTWDVSGGCFELPIESALDRCPGATVSAAGRARGRVTFDGSFAHRVAQSEVDVRVYVPGICALAVGGCSVIESAIRTMGAPDSACVMGVSGDCECEARQVTNIDDADAYTIEGNQIVSTSSGKRWDYCVSDGMLRYHDASSSGAREPGIIELTRR